MNTPTADPSWLESLNGELDLLKDALLSAQASAVEAACQNIQALLRAAPRQIPTNATPEDLGLSAQRLARLQQAVIQSAARSQRAVETLFPQISSATYGMGATSRGHGYRLSA